MFFRASMLGFFLLATVSQVFAQGIFRTFGIPTTVVATGQTELLGPVQVALTLGTTVADTLVIDVSPFQITNTNANDIRLTPAGNVTLGTVSIDTDNNQVKIPVNAGANNGSFRVEGIRVAVAGTNAASVKARVFWLNNGNYLTTPDPLVLADSVQSGLVVDPMTDTFAIVANRITKNTATIVVHEGFKTAFSNSRQFGQNTPTQIRIRVTDFPMGLKMQFPASVTAVETTATLSTVEGAEVELPRSNGGTDVIYNFASAPDSADIAESFRIQFTVSVQGSVELLQPTIQLSLAPIGAAIPSPALPSTSVPRFAEENLLALPGSSYIITKTLYWTGIETSRANKLVVYNPGSRLANLTLTAFDGSGQVVSGTGITNPVKQSLPANQSFSQNLSDIFGPSATVATVRLQSTNPTVVAVGTTSGPGVTDSVSLLDRGLASFDLPIIGDQSRFYFFNPSSSAVSGTLTLRSAAGAVLATANLNVGSMAVVGRSTTDLFGTSAGTQIVGSFPSPIIAFGSFASATTLDSVEAQAPIGSASFYIPFFAVGGGYETDISLINRSEDTVTLTAQLIGSSGTAVGSAKPITLAPSQQLLTTASQLFQLTDFMTGYVQIATPQLAHAMWTYYPAITGHARIRSSQGDSTVIPVSVYTQTDVTILDSGTSTSEFQGLALVNPTGSSVAVTLQAQSPAGNVLSTATVTLGANQMSSKLVSEYFGASIPTGSVIRVTSSDAIVATSITGNLNGGPLRSVTGLR